MNAKRRDNLIAVEDAYRVNRKVSPQGQSIVRLPELDMRPPEGEGWLPYRHRHQVNQNLPAVAEGECSGCAWCHDGSHCPKCCDQGMPF